MSVITTSGLFVVDRGEQRIEVAADGDDLEVGLAREQPRDALTDEVVVFSEHDSNRHRRQAYDADPGHLDTTQATA